MKNDKDTSPLGRDALDYIDSFLTAEEIAESDRRVSQLKRSANMCIFCADGNLVESTTSHVVNLKNRKIVIRNVPCLECNRCGETYYTDEIAEQLEKIVGNAKKDAHRKVVVNFREAM